LSDDLLSEGGQALSSLTEQVVLRLQQLVRRDTKKGFLGPASVRLSVRPSVCHTRDLYQNGAS